MSPSNRLRKTQTTMPQQRALHTVAGKMWQLYPIQYRLANMNRWGIYFALQPWYVYTHIWLSSCWPHSGLPAKCNGGSFFIAAVPYVYPPYGCLCEGEFLHGSKNVANLPVLRTPNCKCKT